ncbi:hypothetical protein [Nocardioides dongxiaopingii]|uniref:hypothetical protein n=1 Tax=Nocardioides dongxiaopingii TaxID=2576036 RepID=UPI0010C7637D|nr:hypothetical protein [Nocardioides dongxiaopingii]
MRQNPTSRRTTTGSTTGSTSGTGTPTGSVVLEELPAAESGPGRVVFVTNAVRRRGGLRTRGEQHRPVLAVVVR